MRVIHAITVGVWVSLLGGCSVIAPLQPQIELNSKNIEKYPLNTGFYLDAQTRGLIKNVHPEGLIERSNTYQFKVGEKLTPLFMGAAQNVFSEVSWTPSLPQSDVGAKGHQAYISITNLKADLKIKIEDQGKYLILGSTFLAKLLGEKFYAYSECELSAIFHFYDHDGNILESKKLLAASSDRYELRTWGWQRDKFSKAVEKTMILLIEQLNTLLSRSDAISLYAKNV